MKLHNQISRLAILVLLFSVEVKANLIVTGTVQYDGAERNLIYDSDQNTTWLDYTKASTTWSGQMGWAAGLTFTTPDGKVMDDWRLPSTIDGPWVLGYDGTTTAGFNITNSEMGHLFYTELGLKAAFDLNGNEQTGWQIINDTSPFKNLVPASGYFPDGYFWSGTELSETPHMAWSFGIYGGGQYRDVKAQSNYALAVFPGRYGHEPIPTNPVPEPTSLLLLAVGASMTLALRRRQSK